ncbi:hypothetical protein LP422_24430 [Janibacter limosus]|uniref:hypothetical protein n=1 Tax=Janibacter limosus TaxID=53458 RepID=UPI0035DF10F2|nr:hypothetical protein LP422_24430 [Janibacter limosus]
MGHRWGPSRCRGGNSPRSARSPPVAAILAALVPAQRLTKLDIVGAMRGRVVTPPPSRWLFVLGLVLAAVGGAGVIIGLDRTEYVIALAAILLVLGTLLPVPGILHALGGLAGPLPLPLRLAVRDLARHRTRSAPTVAAVLAGSAALTMGLIGASSDNTQQQLDYLPQTISGEGYMYAGGTTQGQDAIDRAARELPELAITPVHSYGQPFEEPSPGSDSPAEPFVTTLPGGCTIKDLVSPDHTPRGDVELAPEEGSGNPCLDLSTGSGPIPVMSTISFMPAAEIVRRFDLTGGEARTVTDGGGVLVAVKPEDIVSEGRVALARGTLTFDDDTGVSELAGTTSTSRVPVVVRDRSKDTLARSGSRVWSCPPRSPKRLGGH